LTNKVNLVYLFSMADGIDMDQPTARIILRIFRAFEARVVMAIHAAGFTDISAFHIHVLRHLDPEGLALGVLARDANMSKQAVSKCIRDMAKKSYVSVRVDTGDARVKLVGYTRKGTRMMAVAVAAVMAEEKRYLSTLGEYRYRQLRRSLQQIQEIYSDGSGDA